LLKPKDFGGSGGIVRSNDAQENGYYSLQILRVKSKYRRGDKDNWRYLGHHYY
jgi:hypothetical protein